MWLEWLDWNQLSQYEIRLRTCRTNIGRTAISRQPRPFNWNGFYLIVYGYVIHSCFFFLPSSVIGAAAQNHAVIYLRRRHVIVRRWEQPVREKNRPVYGICINSYIDVSEVPMHFCEWAGKPLGNCISSYIDVGYVKSQGVCEGKWMEVCRSWYIR